MNVELSEDVLDMGAEGIPRQAEPLCDVAGFHPRCEDRIRAAKDTGLRNLPLHGFTQNQIWCELAAMACELTAWVQMLALDGSSRGCPRYADPALPEFDRPKAATTSGRARRRRRR